jgi:hypothetical protein
MISSAENRKGKEKEEGPWLDDPAHPLPSSLEF